MSRFSNTDSYAHTYPSFQPIERGAVAVHNKYDFFRNMWGVPQELEDAMRSNQNIQPMDIIGMYKDRVLTIPSKQLTAMTLNGQASWLTDTASPIFPTAEFNFQSQTREMNMIEYTRTAAGGITNEQTYRTTTWKDTIEKVQLNARLEMDLSLDPNFGEAEWEFQMAGLAANAMLTIYKTVAYSIVHIAYTNLVGENVKHNPYSHARLLQVMTEFFGVVALDTTKYLRMIKRFENTIPDFDTVITAHNSTAYIAELLGESTSMQSQKIVTDETTGELEWRFGLGKKSVGTVNYGDRLIHFVEMPQLRVNMQQTDESREQPLRTSVTVAQAYISNGEIKADDRIGLLSESVLDINIYEQKKNQGDEVKVSVKDAYNASFYYDESSPHGDGLSQIARDFCRHKTQQVAVDSRNIPWRYNPANDEAYKAREDINYESPYDYNTANMRDIAGKEKVRDMRGWRDQFVGVTYVPTERVFRLPQRIADFELAAIPPKWVHRGARGVAAAASAMCQCGMDFDAMMDETQDLLNDIDDEEITDDFLVGLINTNVSRMFDYSRRDTSGAPAFNPSTGPSGASRKESRFANAAQLEEWRPNRFGALDLPKRTGRMKQVYPPFFDSGPGLETLAKEADNPDTDWKEPASRAKRVIGFWELFVRVLQEYVGPSDVVDECLTPPWFHVQSPITVLLDSFRHYKAPLFLALPSALAVSGTAAASGNQNRKRMEQYARDSKTAIDSALDGDWDSVGMLSNLTKFAVIVRTYTGTRGIEVDKVTEALRTLNPSRMQMRLINAMHKIIDFTVNQVYKMNAASATTLNVIVHYTRKILDLWRDLDTATDEQVKELETRFDVFVNSNRSKKASQAAMDMYEAIKDTPNFTANESRLIATNEAIVRMKEREEALKQGAPEVGINGSDFSYDERAQAVNELDRLGTNDLPTDSAQDKKRRDNALAALGLATGDNAPAPKGRTPVSGVQMTLGDIKVDRYLRSPLMASSRLLEYMQRSENPLVKPSDPLLFHEAPLEFVTEESLAHDSFRAHRKGTSVHCSSMPFSHIFKTGISALGAKSGAAGSGGAHDGDSV